MPGIRTLQDIHKTKSDEFLTKLLNSFVIINMQNQGSFFAFSKQEGAPVFYKKGGVIGKIDRLLMKYYEQAIAKIGGIPADVMAQIPDGYQFCFDYLPDDDSASMVLTHIVDMSNGKHIHTTDELQKWAGLFGVNEPNILFEGFLSDEQKRRILDFVYSDEQKLIKKYKTYSFSTFISELFGVKIEEDDTPSLVFRFYNNGRENGAYVGKVIDPLFKQRVKDNEKIHDLNVNDYVYLIIIDLMNFIEKYNIRDLRKFVDPDADINTNYIKLMNEIYKAFIVEFGDKYFNITIDPPKFMKSGIFDINTNLLDDDEVKTLIDIHPNYKEIYKILINFFRRKRRKASGVFDATLLKYFNDLIDKLNVYVLNTNVAESAFPSFIEYIQPLSESFNIFNPLSDEKSFKAYRKVKSTSVMVDEFAPFTNRHKNNIIAMYNKYKLKIDLFAVYDFENAKLPGNLITLMLNGVKNEFSTMINGVHLVKDGSIEDIVNALYPDFRLKYLCSSEARVRDYILYLDFLKNKNKRLNIDVSFKLLPMNFDDDLVIQSLLTDDYNTFTAKTPVCVHNFFPELKSIMSSGRES